MIFGMRLCFLEEWRKENGAVSNLVIVHLF